MVISAEIKKDDAKKELQDVLDKEKKSIQENQKSLLSEERRKALEAQEAKEKKEAEEKRIAIEAQAKKDAELLLKKDEEITDEQDRKRKTELLKLKQEEEDNKLSAEEKQKRKDEKTQRRIDELVNQLKETKDKSLKETELLRKELEQLRKEKTDDETKKPDLTVIVEQEELKRQIEYLEADKSLPREKRREMNKDELEEWLLEDQTEAQAWLFRRELRREREKQSNLLEKQNIGKSKDLAKKQLQFLERVWIKHPELDIRKIQAELKTQGKTNDEIPAIIEKEHPDISLALKIAEEHPEWKYEENAPELAMIEYEKRKSNSDAGNNEIKKLQQQIDEERKARQELEAEIARLKNIDEGIPPGNPPRNNEGIKLSATEEDMVNLMKNNGMPQSSIDEAIKKYREKKKNK